jgi:biopolymer transport protein ExbB/TolQ
MLNFAFLLKWLKNPFVIGGVLAVVTIAYQATRISYLKGKVLRTENKAYVLELELRQCQSINNDNQAEFKKLEQEYNALSDTLETAKKNNLKAVKDVQDSERRSREKIHELQAKIQRNNHCLVSSHNVGLLKSANRQN